MNQFLGIFVLRIGAASVPVNSYTNEQRDGTQQNGNPKGDGNKVPPFLVCKCKSGKRYDGSDYQNESLKILHMLL